jgi:hypothetical protein
VQENTGQSFHKRRVQAEMDAASRCLESEEEAELHLKLALFHLKHSRDQGSVGSVERGAKQHCPPIYHTDKEA